MKYVKQSMSILEQKMNNTRDTGAEIVARTCSGCMVQLQNCLNKQVPGVRMKYVADILVEKIGK